MLRTKTNKRFLSLLCAICILLSLFVNSVPAFASDDEPEPEGAIVTQEGPASDAGSATEASDPEEDAPAAEGYDASSGTDAGPSNQEDEGLSPTDGATSPSTESQGDPSSSDFETEEDEQPTPGEGDADEAQGELSPDEEATGATSEAVDDDGILYNEEPITGSGSHGGVTVTVTAPTQSFPEGTSVSAEAINEAKAAALLSAVGTGDTAVGFNIFFSTAEGQSIQPREDCFVTLSFTVRSDSILADEDALGAILHLYHFHDNGAPDWLKSIGAPAEGVAQLTVQANAFSPYIIVKETPQISVRATRNIPTSTDLADFLRSVSINAPVDENGAYIINPNVSYEMTLQFSEGEAIQFADEETMVYAFPSGVVVGDLMPTTFTITINDQYGPATVSGTYEIVDGKLRVRFNQDDPNFERLKASPNANFNITITSSYDQNEGKIEFAPGIVKEFVFDDSADITINKSVVYDKASDTASYVLKISSAGLNENVVIEDRLTGTALVFNRDVTIESNINGAISVTPDYSSVENGFRVAIPQMANGEVITLRYSATVDNAKISSNGTVEQTNNTARVTSDQVPDGKEASANFAGQANFQRVAKRPVGEPSQIAENLYTQEWKIRVNEDHKLPMGDADISDWIVQNSRPFMQFDGEGLSVVVTFEDDSTETRVVPWSELYVWEGSTGKWGWRYHTPETDGNASYEITCTTLINTNGALGDLSLVNGAQVYGSYDEGTTTIGVISESVFDIRKDAISTTSTESEWKITVSVPGSGLDEMHVVDDAPKLTYEGQSYIDYPLEDSFEVEGLLEGESWRFQQASDLRRFTVTFYKSGTQNEANKGLLPTPDGQPRNIVIRYRTQVNQEWLDLAAEDGYSSSTLYRHRNYASAWSNFYRTQTVDAIVVPIRPELVKDFIEQSDVEIDGVTYPVFRYSLTLMGPVEDGIVIQDSFPTEYLKLYEAAGIQIRGWSNSTPANGNGTVSASDTTEGVAITVSSFPKQNDGSFYSFYMLSYSLIPKDQDALNALNAAAAASQNGIDLENIARWDILESSSTANYTYYPYVDKELLTRPTAENGYVAEFQIIINKYADDLDPTSDVLAIQDVLSSNLRFIPDSLTISPANDSIMVQHNDETNTLTFTEVPDETTFVITYQARVLGQGSVTYSNTVQFGKYTKTIEESTTVSSSGGGTASNPSITLIKRDADSISTTLAGATFQLYYMQDGGMVPVVDRDGNEVLFTTGADGSVLIVGNQQALGWALWEGRTYCLREVVAPTGYEPNQEPTYFVLSKTPSSQIEYDITGDQFSIQNTLARTSISVTKNWIGPAAQSVTVKLLVGSEIIDTTVLSTANNWQHTFADLPMYDEYGTEIEYKIEEVNLSGYSSQIIPNGDGSYTIINTSTETIDIPVEKQWVGPPADAVTVNLLADGAVMDTAELTAADGWKHTFTGLPKYDNVDEHEIVYDVQEDDIPGYIQSRSGTVETGFTFTNTNITTRTISVEKRWDGTPLDSVTVRLYADGVEISRVALRADDSWKHTFEPVPRYDAADGHEIVYTVSEDRITGYTTSLAGDAETGFVITNTRTPSPTPYDPPPHVTPQTGDARGLWMYVLAMVLSAAGLVWAGVAFKRRKNQQQ